MTDSLFIAVDLGAGSGRIFLADFGPDKLSLEEIRRFFYPPTVKNGHLRWDFELIIREIRDGLKQAGCRASEIGLPVQSIGIDSWAVDYGLLDKNGDLIDDPVCYRDDRTSGTMEQVFGLVSRRSIFERTGIQFQNFNTLFQLLSESECLSQAGKMLLLPDLINYFLTGAIASEFTNATTTQLVNSQSGNWDNELIEKLNIPKAILPEIIPAGSDVGNLRPKIAEEVGLRDVHVVVPATHDTASAVAAAPLSVEWAYISSGTWSLIGVETNETIINNDVQRQNFTNEGGVFGTNRFLKNVMGLWILECCRKEWNHRGIQIEYEDIVKKVSCRTGFQVFIYPDDPRFLNPQSMLDAIKQQLRETSQSVDDDPISIAKTIFDSLALRYASVLRSIEKLSNRKLKGMYILGGGGRNLYLNQMTANASGLQVRAGLYEATVIGNAMVQAITAGRFGSLAEARQYIVDNIEFAEFVPQFSPELADAFGCYADIEDRFVVAH